MKTKLLLLASTLISLTLTSCESPNDPGPISRTKDNIESPQTIGTLPDGRVIKMFERDRGGMHNHFIYFVENGDGKSLTISTNTEVSAGKSTRNETTVLIDGVKYAPLEKNEN
jgi:hypothetical protein